VHAAPLSVTVPLLEPELLPLEEPPLEEPELEEPELEEPPLEELELEASSEPPDDEDDIVASPPSSEPLSDVRLLSDASSPESSTSPLSLVESVPELDPDEPPGVPELDPELPEAPELEEPFIEASTPPPTVEVVLDPPPQPTAMTTATKQLNPAQALKTLIWRLPMLMRAVAHDGLAAALPTLVGSPRDQVTRNG
jgi:hypothetical protein